MAGYFARQGPFQANFISSASGIKHKRQRERSLRSFSSVLKNDFEIPTVGCSYRQRGVGRYLFAKLHRYWGYAKGNNTGLGVQFAVLFAQPEGDQICRQQPNDGFVNEAILMKSLRKGAEMVKLMSVVILLGSRWWCWTCWCPWRHWSCCECWILSFSPHYKDIWNRYLVCTLLTTATLLVAAHNLCRRLCVPGSDWLPWCRWQNGCFWPRCEYWFWI